MIREQWAKNTKWVSIRSRNTTITHCFLSFASYRANDVAATGEDSFYFTNYAYYLDSFLHKLEVFLFMRLGTVVYYDGKTYTTVASGFSLPNGITVSKDKK